jgi:hypothetical protein
MRRSMPSSWRCWGEREVRRGQQRVVLGPAQGGDGAAGGVLGQAQGEEGAAGGGRGQLQHQQKAG